MNVVEVYLDNAAIVEPTSEDILVENVADYIPAYSAMTAAIHASRPLRIIVRHRAAGIWLQRAQEKYGVNRISVAEVTRRGRLAEHWEVDIPAWVSEQDIERSDLLDIPPLRAQPGQRFEDVILEGFYSPFLTYDRLPLDYLVDLLDSYDEKRWAAADRRPIAERVKRRRLSAWAEAARSEGEQLLVQGLQEDPGALRSLLCRYRAVRDYPKDVGRRLLGKQFDQLQELHLALDNLQIDAQTAGDALDQIEVYLQTVARDDLSRDVVEQVLNQVSGYLLTEFNAIELMLRDEGVDVDRDLLDHMRSAFAPIQDRIRARLADLDLLIEPDRPPRPEPAWSVEQWLTWATRDYLPYRFWLEEVDQLDEEVAEFAEMYADWLYDNFLSIRVSHPNVVYQAIYNSIRHLDDDDHLDDDCVLLFIIIDNFNYKFFADFRSMLQGHGYFCQAARPYLSMLPSATEVSKKTMAVGNVQPFEGSAYRKPVEETWSEQTGRRVKYLPYVGDLKTVRQRAHDIYILNYMPVDEALHSNTRQTGISHAEAVRGKLRALAGTIHDFALRLGIEDLLRVVICSDHGSTKIPATMPNIIDKAFYADRVTDKHHRYVSVSDAELAALPDNARYQCYFIEKNRFQLDTNYLAARGYYRFVKTNENYYVHGGLTPEESIVPYAVFERVALELKPPTIRLLTDEFRYGVKTHIQMEIVNPNEQSLLNVEVSLQTPNVEADSVSLPEVPGLAARTVTIADARIRRGSDEVNHLAIAVAYEFAGRAYRETREFGISVKSLMETTFDFSDFE
ncbi:MAG: hypothetical protein MAG451_02817 [Anaerolineales bacterium]|nr:hypothetical protein [Anaerolineales bacterium]